MEVTDMFLRDLTKTAEWQTRRIGAQEMQQAVLRWAVAHKDALHSLNMAESLIAVMEARIAAVDADKPKVQP